MSKSLDSPSQSLTDALKDALSFAEAARLFPRHPHAATVWRWATKGCSGIKLQSWQVGGTRYTTRAAIEAFLRELNRGNSPDQDDPLRRSDEAGRALEKLGC